MSFRAKSPHMCPHWSLIELESIEIRERESDGILLTPRDLDLMIAERHECTSIVETGEFVGLRQRMKFADSAMTRNRVLDSSNHVV